MSSYWSKTCSDAYSSPLWQQQQDNYIGCIFAVSQMFPLMRVVSGTAAYTLRCCSPGACSG